MIGWRTKVMYLWRGRRGSARVRDTLRVLVGSPEFELPIPAARLTQALNRITYDDHGYANHDRKDAGRTRFDG